MSIYKHRRGNIVRALAMSLTVLIGVPIALGFLALITLQRSANAQQSTSGDAAYTVGQVASGYAELAEFSDDSEDDIAVVVASPGDRLRPVYETVVEEQRVKVQVPFVDPETGQRRMKTDERVVRIPRRRMRWARAETTQSDDAIAAMTDELTEMKEEDPKRDQLLSDLREKLEAEFNEMHKAQAEQIKQTEERLAKLKSAHDERMKNRDMIVQRRIDQLLGLEDPLQWNPTQPRWSSEFPSSYAPVPGVTLPRTMTVPNGSGQIILDGSASRLRSTTPQPSFPAAPPAPVTNSPPRNLFGAAGDSFFNRTGPAPAAVAESIAGRFPQRTDVRIWKNKEASEDDASEISSLFEVIRQVARAETDLEMAQADIARLKKLAQQGAVGTSELKQVERSSDKYRKALDIARTELDLITAQLKQQFDSAAAAKKLAEEQLALSKAQYNSGTLNREKVVERESALGEASNALRMSELTLKQFQKALDALDTDISESDEAESDSAAEAEAETETEAAYESAIEPESNRSGR
ncbi:MAG: hypothetical protein AAGG48_17005 [Planctomycetota bacterium]